MENSKKYVKKRPNNKNFVRKYRKSIVESMDPKFVQVFGFDKSYQIFERSINKMEKEGDLAEELALQHLIDKNILSENYRTNQVITLGRIKMEADIIDYDNKIVYETKSRRNAEVAKKACKEKWRLFQADKSKSRYSGFELNGIVVENTDEGPIVHGVVDFSKAKYDEQKMEEKFTKYFETLNSLKAIKRDQKVAEEFFKNKKKKKKKTNPKTV